MYPSRVGTRVSIWVTNVSREIALSVYVFFLSVCVLFEIFKGSNSEYAVAQSRKLICV